MAELQTLTAAITVAQLAWNICIFFKDVRNADSTARNLYRKTRHLHSILQNVEAALRRRDEQRNWKSALPNEIQIERNISASVEASRQILLKIDEKVKVLNRKEELSLSRRTVAQVQLVLRQASIGRHENELDIQIQALQTSLGALQL
jgi:hypothetical protein